MSMKTRNSHLKRKRRRMPENEHELDDKFEFEESEYPFEEYNGRTHTANAPMNLLYPTFFKK